MLEQPGADIALMLIGLPGSGKSSFARQLVDQSPGWQLLSTDVLREQLFGQASIQGPWSAIEQALDQQLRASRSAQRPVILDATQARRCHRRRALVQLGQAGYGTVWGFWLREPLGRCCQRNRTRDRQVPRAIIRSMNRSLEAAPPRLNEGFSRLWISQVLPCRKPSGGAIAPKPRRRDGERCWQPSDPNSRGESASAALPLTDSALMATLAIAGPPGELQFPEGRLGML